MTKLLTAVTAYALTIGSLAVYRAQDLAQNQSRPSASSKTQSGNVIINIESNSVPGELHRSITIKLKDKSSDQSVQIAVDSMYFMGDEKVMIELALSEMFLNFQQQKAVRANVRPLMKAALECSDHEREVLLSKATAELKNVLIG